MLKIEKSHCRKTHYFDSLIVTLVRNTQVKRQKLYWVWVQLHGHVNFWQTLCDRFELHTEFNKLTTHFFNKAEWIMRKIIIITWYREHAPLMWYGTLSILMWIKVNVLSYFKNFQVFTSLNPKICFKNLLKVKITKAPAGFELIT